MNNSGENIVKKARLYFWVLLTVFLATSFLPIYSFAESGKITRALNSIKKQIMPNPYLPASTPVILITDEPTPFKTNTPSETLKAVPRPAATQRACFRFRVTHLDGSISNLCYSLSDYNTLAELGYKYTSAKTFYEFHLDGAGDYQAQYEITGSSIYLDAKKSQERQAESEKQKMNAIVGQMQEIERRGY
jgi:hypothetical protein